MARVKPHPCAICGTATMNPIYCSAACKMKAYRKRKKQQKEAEKLTIPMDYFIYQEQVTGRYGIEMRSHLVTFVNKHGKEAYLELLEAIQLITNAEVLF